MRPVVLEVQSRDGLARTGRAGTARGGFSTPCFMPVATRGAIKLLDTFDLDRLQPEVVLGNTYHLMLRPGADTVAALGGLPRFTGWDGLWLTDSGGFQIFSLGADVDDAGVTFKSTYDGSAHRLTPEDAVRIQEQLGSDIQMALDVCCGLPAPESEVHLAARRTTQWAARAREAHRNPDQSLFGIVQGGVSPDLRSESAGQIVELDFDGYAIGGLSVGEPRPEMMLALKAVLAALPEDRPRYLMGVGDPVSLVEAISAGVDMFDCVLPTRLARHGTALTSTGKVQLKAVRWAQEGGPLDPACNCPVCGRFSAGYLRHLLQIREPTGGRLLTLHNLSWMTAFIQDIRKAIKMGQLVDLRRQIIDRWEPGYLR